MSSFRPGFVRANSVTKRLHRYSQICQRMEPRGHYVEPHVQDLSYLLAEQGRPSTPQIPCPAGASAYRSSMRAGGSRYQENAVKPPALALGI
jgi:hypothetical protein